MERERIVRRESPNMLNWGNYNTIWEGERSSRNFQKGNSGLGEYSISLINHAEKKRV